MTFFCSICQSKSFRLIHRKAGWSYLECRGCGLVTLSPKPTLTGALAHYIDYLPADRAGIAAWGNMMAPVISRSAKILARRTDRKTGHLLDVGCGYGFFLNAMKQRGWTVAGIEISPNGSAHARRRFGVPVYEKPLADLKFAENSFDVVTLFYVIEHLLDPIDVLREVWRILKPGGIVLLRWPHTTPIIKLLGRAAAGFDLYHTPYHLYDFSVSTIQRLLRQAGFSGIETEIGGFTLPTGKAARWASVVTGLWAETLFRLSMKTWLLPGVSKTTTAFKRLQG